MTVITAPIVEINNPERRKIMDELRVRAIADIEERHEVIGTMLNRLDLTTASIRDLDAIRNQLKDAMTILAGMMFSGEVCFKEPE